ncbi:DUF192 domain-containing protein [Coraliomargarita akajimensis]|nr:DUF192 domain-containing protein [Coraliomargarita akajimensis]
MPPFAIRLLLSALFALLPLGILSGCSSENESPTATTQTVVSKDTYFPAKLGSKELQLQLALNDAERAKGLMFRESLNINHGMLFVFEKSGPRAFWMKNTLIPLDLAYLDHTGTVLELHKLYPHDERPVASRSQSVSMVLEMNSGWFEQNQLSPGARLDLEAIKSAIQARGHQPENFSL